MRLQALFLAALLAGGCAARTQIAVGSGSIGALPPPGTSVSSSQVGVDLRGGSAAALIAAGTIGALLSRGEESGERFRFMPPSQAPAPTLLEGRAVNVQDCTQPIKDPTANLRCR